MKKLFTVLNALLLMSVITMAQTPGLRKVTLQLKWWHQFQFAGYYAAIEKGFYAAEGLDVKLLECDENIRSTDAVFDGRAEFGVSNTDVILMKDKGRDPVVLAAIFQHSPLVLAASVKAGISNVHQLKGKRIAMEDYEGDLLAYLSNEGLKPGCYTRLKHNYNLKDILSGRIDATTAYVTDELYELDKAGFEYSVFSGRSANIDFYGDVLFTSEKLMKKNPDLVERFRRASVKGWKYAMANVDEMIDIIYSKYSTRKTKEHLRFEADRMNDLLLADVVEIGYFTKGRWETILETYKKTGLVRSDLSIDGMLYSDYREEGEIPWGIISVTGAVLLVSWVIFFILYRSRSRYIKELEVNKKLTAELAEAGAEKDKFFSIIAHDLRNPFMGLLNFSTILEEDLDELSKEDIKRMAGNLRSISEKTYVLLNELLDWAMLKRGQMKFESETIDLKMLTEEKLYVVKSLAEHKDITISAELAGGIKVTADRNMIGSVILNLLTNAIKFTPRGGTVEVYSGQNDSRVELHVKDSGIGIPEEMISGLFAVTGKKGRRGTEGENSTGLGLMLCKEFLEKNGGTINARSEEGKGSDFYFTLPVDGIDGGDD